MNRNKNLRTGRRQLGQGMTEYIIIVALIAIAAIGVFSMFGKTVRNQAAGVAMELSGKKGDTQIENAGTAADAAGSRANERKGMSEYDKANDSQ